MDTKFSKSPWKINKDDAASILDADGNEIAEVFQDFGPWKYDAVLMAESPNMYELLIRTRTLLQDSLKFMQNNEDGIGPDCTDHIQGIIDTDATLAKARGKS